VTTGAPAATLTYSKGVSLDGMGWSVAISGDGSTIFASAVGVNNYKGAVYVFVRPNSGWATTSTPAATLTNFGGVSLDRLGFSVATNEDGSTIAAGATWVNHQRGAAYVFVKPGGGWTGSILTPTATLTNSTGQVDDELGFSVAMSADGSSVEAGAPYASGNKGAVYVFVKSGSWMATGVPAAALTNFGGVSADQLGSAVAMSADGSTLVAGAQGVQSYTGAAYVFVKPGGGWATTSAPDATLTYSGGAHHDDLGYSVAINSDGATIVLGAPGRVSNSKAAGYVFVKSGNWVTTATPTSAVLDGYAVGLDDPGHSVALDANSSTVVAGDNYANAVYVFPWFPRQLFLPLILR
jgi:hypothetical protein